MKFRRDVLWLLVVVLAVDVLMTWRVGRIDPHQETDDVYEAVIRNYQRGTTPLFISLHGQDWPGQFMHRFGDLKSVVRQRSEATITYEHGPLPKVVDPLTKRTCSLLDCEDIVEWERGVFWREPEAHVYATVANGAKVQLFFTVRKHDGRWQVTAMNS